MFKERKNVWPLPPKSKNTKMVEVAWFSHTVGVQCLVHNMCNAVEIDLHQNPAPPPVGAVGGEAGRLFLAIR